MRKVVSMGAALVAISLIAPRSTCAQVFTGAGLELRLSLTQAEVLQGEPVVVTLSLQNISEQRQSLYLLFEPEYGPVTYQITGPGDRVHRFRPLWEAVVVAKKEDLAPKEVVRHHQLLLYSANWGVHFKEPGEYQVRAVYGSVLTSNAVTVKVRAATGVDAEALEHFRGNPQAKFLLGATTAWAIGDEFETILRKYPESRYAPWCHYALGRAWQLRTEKVDEKMRSEKAIGHFQTLVDKYPDFPLAVEMQYRIAQETIRMGREQEGLERIHKLIAAHPDLHFFQYIDRRIRLLEKAGYAITAEELP